MAWCQEGTAQQALFHTDAVLKSEPIGFVLFLMFLFETDRQLAIHVISVFMHGPAWVLGRFM